MYRPKSFDDVIGHDWLITYLKDQLSKGTLHHFIIMDGAEGLGKTSLADLIAITLVYGFESSPEKEKAMSVVVDKGESNNYIKKYKLSLDGGKDVAKEVRDEMTNTFNLSRNKVIICDECHNLSDAAQDVFLSDTEFLSDKVYVIMLTTELDRLKKSLRSRSVHIHLNTLKMSDMVAVLKREVERKNLILQNEDITLSMIAEVAECKPRTGLNVLNAFSDGDKVSVSMIRELIGYLDVQDVLPLLSSLSGSISFGLNYISEMRIDTSLINIVSECVKIKDGMSSYKLKFDDMKRVREQLIEVSLEQLIKFLYGLTRHTQLTRVDVINSFLSAHAFRKSLTEESPADLLNIEKGQKIAVSNAMETDTMSHAPTLDDLMMNSDMII